MITAQSQWCEGTGWTGAPLGELVDAQLVLVFGGNKPLGGGSCFAEIREAYPNAHVLGCSTAGEICDVNVLDDSVVATAVRFESTRVVGHSTQIDSAASSFETGERLSQALSHDGLAHVFVLSDGLNINGSDLVRGLTAHLPANVTVTGGLSGDGDRFGSTLVIPNDSPRENTVAVIGLYGDALRVGYASLGGWDTFGPMRQVTKSDGNVLFELDGRSALSLYKEYLGEHAEGLPATGLLFPLAIKTENNERSIVRTILSVDDDSQSMTFAGDLPEGAYAQLMKANFNRLVDGAGGAAKNCIAGVDGSSPDLAILISCVGRKMVLKQRIEDEVEAVRDVVGPETVMTGFYSYGEISPFTPNARCELHNQTMTITTLTED